MNIEISEIDCVMVEDEEGMGGNRGAKSGEAADLADAGAELPRPEAPPILRKFSDLPAWPDYLQI